MSNGYEMRYTDFRKFGDVVIDLQKMAMLDDVGVVVLTDGTKIGVGKEAADAIRSYFTPASARKNGLRSGTSDTAKESVPCQDPDSPAASEESEAAQGQPDSRSCVVTSSPADGSAGGEDGTSAEEGASTETAEK